MLICINLKCLWDFIIKTHIKLNVVCHSTTICIDSTATVRISLAHATVDEFRAHDFHIIICIMHPIKLHLPTIIELSVYVCFCRFIGSCVCLHRWSTNKKIQFQQDDIQQQQYHPLRCGSIYPKFTTNKLFWATHILMNVMQTQSQ